MGRQLIRIAVPGLTILGVHLVIVAGQPVFALSVLAAAALVHLALHLTDGGGARGALILAAIAAALLAVQAGALLHEREMARLVTLPPVLIHGWLAYFFARTLLPGREPLIARFSRLHRPSFPPELARYCRRLTALWAGLLAGLTVASAVLGLTADLETWSWLVNLAMPGLSAALFLLEHAYRGIAFRHLGNNSPMETLRTLARPDTWTAP